MEILEQMGLALGLASLAGVNLYLTVLVTGVLVRFDLLQLADRFESVEALGHPWVLAVAGSLFVIEFITDKVPWVDSLWDSVHTVIRPVGGVLLALQAMGDMPPYMEVVAGLLAGGAALTTHGAKAGTRLVVNHSPEPFSNVSMSLVEDIGVVGGTFLALLQPVAAFCIFSGLLILLWVLFPQIVRAIRASLWFVWSKLRMPGRREPLTHPEQLERHLDSESAALLRAHADIKEGDVSWTAAGVTGKSKGWRGLKPNLQALLVVPKEGDRVHVVTKRGFRDPVISIPMARVSVDVESRFLSDNVSLISATQSFVLRFPRGHSGLVETVALRLKEMSGGAELATEESVDSDDLAPVPAV
jgi:hypothetical protein